ncbi:MAG: hypothetical protein ACYTG7_20335 [Planctomycetota bacterium]|jgi:hypothetical protein
MDTLSATDNPAYGISNGFSLEALPGGSHDPMVPASGEIEISLIHVDQAKIKRILAQSGPVYQGQVVYDVACSNSNLFVWLELSFDNGSTWSERRIHTVGHVGATSPGQGKVAHWLVDGDHGHQCKIRVRVKVDPSTYDNLDASQNKYPLPVPYTRYPNLERQVSVLDGFDFTHADAALPQVEFYKSIAPRGEVKAGFARMRFFHYEGQYVENPIYFLHCIYLDAKGGEERYVILQGDVQKLWTDTIHMWRDQINSTFGIPKDHIMVLYTHVHNSMSRFPGVETFPTTLLEEAIADAAPIEVAFVNHEMGNTFNVHRCVMTDFKHAHSSFCNGVYANPHLPYLPVIIVYGAMGEIISAWLDASAVSSEQLLFDGPADSRLQMLLFRKKGEQTLRSVLVKWTGHPVNRDYDGDLPRCVMDTFQDRFGDGVEVLYSCGFGGNHRQLFAQEYPAQFGSPRTAEAFADVLEDVLPSLLFRPLTRLGMVIGYDTFGAREDNDWMRGIDPDRYGVGVQVFRFNNFYLSTLPGEAPAEQGLYIRARTCDVKHMYNAYGNTFYNYYNWGRWHDIQHYESSNLPNRYESFRMAQEIVRGVNILEQAMPRLEVKAKAKGVEAFSAVN